MPTIDEIPTIADEAHRPPPHFVNDLIITENHTKYGRAFSFFRNMNSTIDYSKSVRPRRNVHAWHGSHANINHHHEQYPVNNFINNTPVYRIGEFDKNYGEHIHSESNRNAPKKRKTNCQRMMKAFDEYCDKSTLHGLRYVGDNSLSVGERLFWFGSFATAVFFAIYFITSIFTKFNTNPVIISFNPEPVLLTSIPFPSITICNVNVATKMAADRINMMGSAVDQILLSDMCSANNTLANNTDVESKVADWSYVRNFIISISQSCSEMFKLCKWENNEIPCDFFINTVLTDDGYCCAFNRLPSNYSLRDTGEQTLNQTYLDDKLDWNPEDGYPESAGPMTLPIRSQGAGSHLGLSIVIDADLDQYYCSTTNSIGFKALLSTPIESPKIADMGFLISPGVETRIELEPIIKDATLGILGIDIKKRQCYFTRERYLAYFRVYNERNCRLECQANYTLQQCNCVPYYLPRLQDTKICSKNQQVCSDRAKLSIEKYTPERLSCSCLPGCHEITYTKIISVAKMTSLNGSLFRDLADKNISSEYIINNLAVVHFYFKNDKFTKQTKSELYGFSEFLSNTGGLLGLFMGFSFLSAVEIFYFVVVRVCCKIYKKNKIHRKEMLNGDKSMGKKVAGSLPFVK